MFEAFPLVAISSDKYIDEREKATRSTKYPTASAQYSLTVVARTAFEDKRALNACRLFFRLATMLFSNK